MYCKVYTKLMQFSLLCNTGIGNSAFITSKLQIPPLPNAQFSTNTKNLSRFNCSYDYDHQLDQPLLASEAVEESIVGGSCALKDAAAVSSEMLEHIYSTTTSCNPYDRHLTRTQVSVVSPLLSGKYEAVTEYHLL
jgi:hypothetical protein